MKTFFMQTERIGFGLWTNSDIELAKQLWKNSDVRQFICANGKFSEDDIQSRLNTEINNGYKFNVQYWPIFKLETGDLIGC